MAPNFLFSVSINVIIDVRKMICTPLLVFAGETVPRYWYRWKEKCLIIAVSKRNSALSFVSVRGVPHCWWQQLCLSVGVISSNYAPLFGSLAGIVPYLLCPWEGKVPHCWCQRQELCPSVGVIVRNSGSKALAKVHSEDKQSPQFWDPKLSPGYLWSLCTLGLIICIYLHTPCR